MRKTQLLGVGSKFSSFMSESFRPFFKYINRNHWFFPVSLVFSLGWTYLVINGELTIGQLIISDDFWKCCWSLINLATSW